jgi:DHA2 family lincomycin resistance protein-like MFS transporter
MIGTTQQVAGGAGTALFVAVMTSHAAGLVAGGNDALAATTGGIRAAFLCGAVISLGAVVAAFFVKRSEGGSPIAATDKK